MYRYLTRFHLAAKPSSCDALTWTHDRLWTKIKTSSQTAISYCLILFHHSILYASNMGNSQGFETPMTDGMYQTSIQIPGFGTGCFDCVRPDFSRGQVLFFRMTFIATQAVACISCCSYPGIMPVNVLQHSLILNKICFQLPGVCWLDFPQSMPNLLQGKMQPSEWSSMVCIDRRTGHMMPLSMQACKFTAATYNYLNIGSCKIFILALSQQVKLPYFISD